MCKSSNGSIGRRSSLSTLVPLARGRRRGDRREQREGGDASHVARAAGVPDQVASNSEFDRISI